MRQPKPADGVHFGKLVLSPAFLADITDEPRRRFLAGKLLSLTRPEIGHGLSHPNGKGLLKMACEKAGVDYSEITRDC